MSRIGEARRAYERALALDEGATYASTNLARLPAIQHARAEPGATPSHQVTP